MAVARANARMALMFAIGELQKQAGPDQRVTATADMAGANDGSALSAGGAPANNVPLGGTSKGLTAVQPGSRYWTGVWRNANTTNPGTTIYTKTPAPELLKWLISGNEAGSSNTNNMTPDSQVAAVGSNGSISDATKAVILAGKNTIGDPSSDTLDRYVSAPLVPIAADSKSAKYPTGRQAWWVGDEGVKAKLNITPPANGSSSSDLTYERLSAQRRGWETVDGFGNYPTADSAGASSLAKVVTLPQAGLLDSGLSDGSAPPLGRAFHSATADSFGLLTDTLQGGLKLDLSAFLSGGLPSSSPTDVINGIASNQNIVPISVAPKIKGPKWSRLKEFYDLSQQIKSSGKLTVKAASQVTDAAIAPVIVDFRLLLGVKLTLTSADTFKVQPCAKVAISLANPYPYPLEWTSALDLEIKNVTDPARRASCIFNAPTQPAYLSYNNGAAVLYNTIFKIPAGTLPPGEARAYTMNGPTLRPLNSTGTINVNLGAFSSSSPASFDNCVLMDSSSLWKLDQTTNPPGSMNLDVREDATTSQINVELRSGSASAVLRKIERFELDNANFDQTKRVLLLAQAKLYTKPFPLQYYGFQLSQPGVDYGSILPDKGQLGLRSSTLRTYTDFNVQATRFRKPIISYNPPPYFMMIANSPSTLPFVQPGGDAGTEFTKNLNASPLPWGHSPFTSRHTVLFSPPETLVSLAQLQHADLTADDIYVSVGHQPGNAVGNSYASPFVPRANTIRTRSDFNITNFTTATSSSTNYYDISYLLNAALWDTYFFSTISGSGSPEPLNKSMVKIKADENSPELKDGELAASRLFVNGAQNVNCTDKDAWKALLSSSKGLHHKAASGSSKDAIFPRSLEQLAAGSNPPSGSEEDSFAGFRQLNDDQIDTLATEIVKQVRLRGPFVSLSQFVNRSLATLTVAQAPLVRSGALQGAIDAAVLNTNSEGTKTIFGSSYSLTEDKVNLQYQGGAPRADLAGSKSTTLSNSGTDGIWPTTSFDLNPGAVAGIMADRTILTNNLYKSEQGYRSSGIPGWLTQADVLQVIGPVLSVRSDTFRVRAYGEALDPTTGVPIARAWCEAIVQRMPEYVDGSDSVSERPGQLLPVNTRFGRRFETVSFKWLSPDEI